jgi:hypothetical protein
VSDVYSNSSSNASLHDLTVNLMGMYRQKYCLLLCFQKALIEKCNCWDIRSIRYSSNYKPCNIANVTEPCNIANVTEPCNIANVTEPCNIANVTEPCNIANVTEPCNIANVTELDCFNRVLSEFYSSGINDLCFEQWY